MGLFEHWPYTNFHDLNLDWIISKVRKIDDNVSAAQTSAESAAGSAEAAAGSAEDAAENAQSIPAALNLVNDLNSDVEVISARLDNIVAQSGSTEGNTELQDIRVDNTGLSFANAGSAVRGQMNNVIYMLNNLNGIIEPAMEIGSIGTNGADLTATNAVRTAFISGVGVYVWSDHAYRVYYYQEDETYINRSNQFTTPGYHSSSNANAKKLRIVFYSSGGDITDAGDFMVDSAISTSESPAFRFLGRMNVTGDTTLKYNDNGYKTFPGSWISNIDDLPDGWSGGGAVITIKPFSAVQCLQILIGTAFNIYMRYGTNWTDWKLTNPAIPDIYYTDTRWAALGDSITQGYYSANGEIAGVTEENWVNQVRDINKYTTVNYGEGGSGYIHSGTVGDKTNAREKVDLIDFSNYDLVTLAYGVNDWHYNQQIGESTDSTSAATMAGNMKYCIEKILADNPLCKIVVLLPQNCSKYGGDFSTNWGLGHSLKTSGTLQHVIDVEKEICEYYNIQYVDMSSAGIVNRSNINGVLPDGIHPSLDCYKQMAKIIARAIMFA